MERVIVIGCPGSGKSTFARKLAEITRLPLFHLDLIWHMPDRTTLSREHFDKELDEILATDRWIIDGNYSRTLSLRLQRCDTIFLFDLPTDACLEGVRNRIGTKRPDMPWTETEFDEDFRQWIINFKRDRLPEIESTLETRPADVRLVRFGSREAAYRLLSEI